MNITPCEHLLQPLLTSYAATNAQFPLYLFSDINCQSLRYPAWDEFNLWEQYLPLDSIGFSTIKSLYIPPQSVLQLYGSGGEGYYALQGPQIISDTSGLLAFWYNADGTPCTPGTVNCGSRVNWTLSATGKNTIQRLRIHNPVNWIDTLASLAANKQTLSLAQQTLTFDNDTLYTELCQDVATTKTPGCQCHLSWQYLLTQHPTSASQSFVNILPNGCNALTQYVPTRAPIGQGTPAECQQQISAQLQAGTFLTLSQGGAATYICSNKTYINALSNGSTEPLARFDDEAEAQQEQSQGQSQKSSTTAYWVLGSLILFALLLFLLYRLQRSAALAKVVKRRVKEGRLMRLQT